MSSRGSHIAEWERTQRPRVWRGQGKLLCVAFFNLLTWSSFIAGVWFGLHTWLQQGDPGFPGLLAVSASVFVVSLIIRSILGATVKCPLCHGTPFSEKRCRKNKLANKLPLLTYRASAIMHLLFRGSFRCMYCSTPFRLGRKESSR